MSVPISFLQNIQNNAFQQADICVGLQHGDEGKGKVSLNLTKKNNYDLCVRFNGGPNAGHSVYYNNEKIVLHQIPCGIIHNIPCVIGPGCVVDLRKLSDEIRSLSELNLDIENLLFISNNAHLILKDYIKEDVAHDTIGSTGSGIRPAYREKYNRKGIRYQTLTKKQIYEYFEGIEIKSVDIHDLIKTKHNIFFEGAQGFELDIDWGDYPYVTSSSVIAGAACNCISPKKINNIYGICKAYDTYVGNKIFEPTTDIRDINRLGNLGHEYGATTGRRRQCNWLNLDKLIRAIEINGANNIIMNKCDIIKELQIFKLTHEDKLISFYSWNEMKLYIDKVLSNIPCVNLVTYSFSKFEI